MLIGDNIMDRKILADLLEWKDKKDKLPLIVQGARQIGKTHIIREVFSKYYTEL